VEYFFELVFVSVFFSVFLVGLLFLIYKGCQLELHGIKASKAHDFVKEFQRH